MARHGTFGHTGAYWGAGVGSFCPFRWREKRAGQAAAAKPKSMDWHLETPFLFERVLYQNGWGLSIINSANSRGGRGGIIEAAERR